jgi:acyl-CoA synthetase (AMP-forming)/AMP-acid ligase II/acyl carrier protein
MKQAICHGSPLQREADFPATLPEALSRTVRQTPKNGVLHLQADGSETFQSYLELKEEAERILHGLRQAGLKPQDKVLFQLERTQDFLSAFWGCVLGGFVPVPVSIAPTYQAITGTLTKLQNAWEMLGRPIVLAGDGLLTSVRSLPQMLALPGFRVESISELKSASRAADWHPCKEEDLALLLLTSGSTGMPKAVMLNHRNILARSIGTCQKHGYTADEISLNWFPLDHVGGLVMFHLRDVFLGCRQIHAPIDRILENPLCWLDWIDRYRVTLTWAPNFAYSLINDQAARITSGNWDISSLTFILNAGEAIVARTTRRFLTLLAPHGLRGDCMHPAWGMSETSSAYTYSDHFQIENTSDTDAFVCVGAPIPGASIRIVNAQDECVKEGETGRLQVRGLQVTPGYYNNPALTAESFTTDGWFQTGDLGTLADGQLTITGREKDVIIINGINYYSHEIEAVIEEITGIAPSFTAAMAVREADSETDKLAIFFHTCQADPLEIAALTREVRSRVRAGIGLNPSYLLAVAKEDIPKTAIGKIQRSLLRKRFEAGEFNDNLRLAAARDVRDYAAPRSQWEKQVAGIWQGVLEVPRVGINDDFFELGGHSLLAAQMLSRLRAAFHISFSLRHLFEAPTVAQMCAAIEQLCIEEAAQDEIEDLLIKIKNLSDAEVELILKSIGEEG